jgi:hypothetical protein
MGFLGDIYRYRVIVLTLILSRLIGFFLERYVIKIFHSSKYRDHADKISVVAFLVVNVLLYPSG